MTKEMARGLDVKGTGMTLGGLVGDGVIGAIYDAGCEVTGAAMDETYLFTAGGDGNALRIDVKYDACEEAYRFNLEIPEDALLAGNAAMFAALTLDTELSQGLDASLGDSYGEDAARDIYATVNILLTALNGICMETAA